MLSTVLRNSEFTNLTDAQCVAKLDEDVVIGTDNYAYTWSSLNLKLIDMGVSLSIIKTWDTTIASLEGGSMLDRMLSATGVDFTLDSVRSSIQSIIDDSVDQDVIYLLNKLLEVGITNGKLWEKYALDALPTEAGVAAARQIITNQDDASALLNECINPLIAQNKSLAEIKTAVAAWGE